MKRGFSLVELILTVVILAVSIYGSLIILGGMSRQSSDAEKQTLAMEYGKMRLEQILSKRFDEQTPDPIDCSLYTPENSFGLDAGETTSTGDDVDDLYSPTTPLNLSTDPLYTSGLATKISVWWVAPDEGTFGAIRHCPTPPCTPDATYCYKRITVEVVDTHNNNQSLATVRTMVSPYK